MRIFPQPSTQRFRRAVFAIGLSCLLMWTAGGLAQDLPIAGPELRQGESIDRTVAPDYWIASSRACCQKNQTRCPKGSLDYFAVDASQQLTPFAEPAFLASLDYQIPICFVIHGDLTSFADVRRAAPRIVKWIKAGSPGQPVQIVFYTWPSDDETNPIPQLDISARGERAEFNGCYLAQLISQFPAEARLSFFGHSFGARVTAATLHLMAGGSLPGCGFRCEQRGPRSYRAVFAAGAIDRDWLNPGNRYGRALLVTEWLLNLRNGADFVINLYPLQTLFGRQALGRVGFSPSDRLRMGPLASRISEWDVTHKIGTRHAWVYYYARLEISKVIGPVLTYPNPQTIAASPKMPVASPALDGLQGRGILRDSTRIRRDQGIRSGL